MPSHLVSSDERRLEAGKRSDLDVPARVEEQRERQAFPRRQRDAVGRRSKASVRHPFQHVAEVAHERVRNGRDLDPLAADADLQTGALGARFGRDLTDGAVVRSDRPGAVADRQQGQEPVVGVFGHPPLAGESRVRGRVTEDPEQDRRIGAPTVEPVGFQAQVAGDAREDRPTDPSDGVHPLEHGGAEVRWVVREQVRPVHRSTTQDPGFVRGQFDPEVDAFLAVRNSAGELVAHLEPSPPRRPAERHRDPRASPAPAGRRTPLPPARAGSEVRSGRRGPRSGTRPIPRRPFRWRATPRVDRPPIGLARRVQTRRRVGTSATGGSSSELGTDPTLPHRSNPGGA